MNQTATQLNVHRQSSK